MKTVIKNIGVKEAHKKATSYCAYQERNQQEVRDKLYSFGLYPEEVEELISKLVEENYLNEERFAIAFAGGKFRMKSWGKIKIRYELKQKRISDYCIKKALLSIDDEAYQNTLLALYQQIRKNTGKEKNIFKRKRAIWAWLLRKGYESDLISDLLKHDNTSQDIDN